MTYLPPAGTPLHGTDIRRALSGVIRPATAERLLVERLERLFPGSSVTLSSSGRAALTRALSACRRAKEGRDEVLIGGFTCWSVAASVRRAGLTIRLADIDPVTLDFDETYLGRIDGSRLLAVVTHHLLGYPNRIAPLEEFARRWGAFLIDDAAQGFGARIDGRRVGSAGEAAILSFGRGKGLAALGGGALLARPDSPIAPIAREEGRPLRGWSIFAGALGHRVFFHRTRYSLPARLGALGIGMTLYDESFGRRPIAGYAAALAERLAASLDPLFAHRCAAARHYDSLLDGARNAVPIAIVPGGEGAYLRYGVRVGAGAAEIVRRGRPLGIGRLYPGPVTAIPGLPRRAIAGEASLTGSEEVARTLVTLPTHPLVSADDRTAAARFVEEES